MSEEIFKNKTILVTGGTGSFGNVVVRKLLERGCSDIRVFSRDELKQESMRQLLLRPEVSFFIGDVRDISSLNAAMRGVNYVFHAAALKQVPSCEFFPMEATLTNVIGTQNVLDSAANANVERVIVLSTDKAVYPINAMGISKALMEKVAIGFSRRMKGAGPKVAVTRYGNVMSSRGSVIPLFASQLKAGKPITITDPMMTRFLMSLDDAFSLVDYAFRHSEGGEIYVQKAPAATVAQIASAVTKILEKEESSVVIGKRHAEKLHEALLSSEERASALDLDGYFCVPMDNRDLLYQAPKVAAGFTLGTNAEAGHYGSDNAYRLSDDEVVALFRSTRDVRVVLGI
jgi:UDP-N-acetylglucosamine 4,6-dehydratase/5-epimerase